jgi:predicted DNA-binding transcriptional regulator AlpA
MSNILRITPPPSPEKTTATASELAVETLTRPLLVRRQAAAKLLDMSVATLDRADAAGLIPASRTIGGCKLWAVSELSEWCDRGCPPRAEWSARWAAILAAKTPRR